MKHHDVEFDAIVAGLTSSAVPPPERRSTDVPEIQRIASAVFCSAGIDPSIVAFAVRRAAQHLRLREDEIDVAVTVALLANAARVTAELRSSDAA